MLVDDNDASVLSIRILRLLLRVDSVGSVVKAVVNEMMLLMPLVIPLERASMIGKVMVETVMAGRLMSPR
jgi:hypothetical protein